MKVFLPATSESERAAPKREQEEGGHMAKRKVKVDTRVFKVVTLDLIWTVDKYDTITNMARINGVELADMVDEILDDWAALAAKEAGIEGGERRLRPYIEPTGESA